MATNMFDATYFADRHSQPAMINIKMQKDTITALFTFGAKLQVLGGGARFQGKEIYIPPSTFPIFDTLRSNGKIVMRLTPISEWDIPLPK